MITCMLVKRISDYKQACGLKKSKKSPSPEAPDHKTLGAQYVS